MEEAGENRTRISGRSGGGGDGRPQRGGRRGQHVLRRKRFDSRPAAYKRKTSNHFFTLSFNCLTVVTLADFPINSISLC